MTLTLELPPDLETRLNEAAARAGQAPEVLAVVTIDINLRPAAAESVDVSATNTELNGVALPPLLSLEEFDAALDELEEIGADIPPPTEYITYSREDIYFDHD